MKLQIKICPECNEQYLTDHICKGKKRPSKKKKKTTNLKSNIIEKENPKKLIFDIQTCPKCKEKYYLTHKCNSTFYINKELKKIIIEKYIELCSIEKTCNFFVTVSDSIIKKIIYNYNKTRPSKLRKCLFCNKNFRTKNMKRKYCSKKCSSNAQKSNYIYSQKQVRFQIFLRDNFTCIYCGRTSFTHNIELQLDHVVARNNNGTDSIDNYATSCKDCNLSKKDKKLSQETEQKILSEIKKRNEIFDYNKFSLPITFL